MANNFYVFAIFICLIFLTGTGNMYCPHRSFVDGNIATERGQLICQSMNYMNYKQCDYRVHILNYDVLLALQTSQEHIKKKKKIATKKVCSPSTLSKLWGRYLAQGTYLFCITNFFAHNLRSLTCIEVNYINVLSWNDSGLHLEGACLGQSMYHHSVVRLSRKFTDACVLRLGNWHQCIRCQSNSLELSITTLFPPSHSLQVYWKLRITLPSLIDLSVHD